MTTVFMKCGQLYSWIIYKLVEKLLFENLINICSESGYIWSKEESFSLVAVMTLQRTRPSQNINKNKYYHPGLIRKPAVCSGNSRTSN